MSIVNLDVHYSLSVNSRKCISLDLQLVGHWPDKWKKRVFSRQTSTQMSLRENGTAAGKGHLQI